MKKEIKVAITKFLFLILAICVLSNCTVFFPGDVTGEGGTATSVYIKSIETDPEYVSQGQQAISVKMTLANNSAQDILLKTSNIKFYNKNLADRTIDYTYADNTSYNSDEKRIENGTELELNFLVSVLDSAESGEIVLDGNIEARTSDQAEDITNVTVTTTDNYDKWIVQKKASLKISGLDLSSLFASLGSKINIEMLLSNLGEAGANISDLGLHLYDSNGNDVTDLFEITPEDCPEELAGGTEQVCTFGITPKEGAPTGELQVEGEASATDSNSNLALAAAAVAASQLTTQTPCVLNIKEISIANTEVSTGQTAIEASTTVENTGEATCSQITISHIFKDSNSIPKNSEYTITASSSNPSSITGLTAVTFVHTVAVASTATTGTIIADASIAGVDANSVSSVSDIDSAITDSFIVKRKADISIEAIATTPTEVRQGETNIAVTMSIKNNGEVTAKNISPSLIFKDASANNKTSEYSSLASVNNPTTIAGGITSTFNFTISISSTATYGNITIDGSATGNDNNSNESISDAQASTTDLWRLLQPATLSISTVTVNDYKITAGETLTLSITVANSGEIRADNVVPSVTKLGTGTALVASSPATQNINAASSATFTYTYNTTTSDTTTSSDLAFSVTASGTDNNTGASVTSTNTLASDYVNIQTAPNLVIGTVTTSPSTVTQGQTSITISYTVSNTGEATANVTSASLKFTVSAVDRTSQYTITASGANPTSISGNGSGTFSFTVSVDAAATTGVATIDGTISGTDDNIPANTVSDTTANTTDSFTVQTAATFVIGTISVTSPTTAQDGSVSRSQDNITVTMTVQNTGQATANISSASLTFKNGATSYTSEYTVTASNDNATTISGSSTVTLSYSITISSTATTGVVITIDGNVSGTDNNTSSTISDNTASTTDSWTVSTAASFGITTITTAPTTVSRGQTGISVTMAVQNSGEIKGNVSSANLVFKYGGTDKTSDYTITADGGNPTSINAGATGTFTYTVSVGASAQTGSITIDGTVSGTDNNSGKATSDSSATTTDSWTVQTPAALSATVSIYDDSDLQYSIGQTIKVKMTVTNTGEAQANTVAPSAITLAGTSAGSTLSTGPTPASANITGGTSQDFVYTYATTDATAGTINFAGSASGTDANTTNAVSSSSSTSSNGTIQTVAVFSIQTVSTTPTTVSRAQTSVSISYTVNNTGQATANIGSASLTFKDGTLTDRTADYTITASGVNPTTISGGSTATLTFSVNVSGTATTGAITIDGTISGTDYNAGTAISDTSAATTDSFTVQTAASLSITSITTASTTVTQGQSGISVTMTVENTGQATANISTGSLTFRDADSNSKTSQYSQTQSNSVSTIAGGASQDFTYTVAVKLNSSNITASTGVITIDGTVSGTDANSSAVTSDTTATTTDSWTVQALFTDSSKITDTTYGIHAAFGDYDNDGDQDIILANYVGNGYLYKYNSGASTYADDRSNAGLTNLAVLSTGVLFGDHNNDSYLDTIISRAGLDLALYQNYNNSTAGSYSSVSVTAFPANPNALKTAWVDYDNDNNLDLYVGISSGALYMFKNGGSASYTLTDQTSAAGLASITTRGKVAFGDYDGDRDQDFFANTTSTDLFYKNNGNATFTSVASSTTNISGATDGQASFGDYDNDSDVDLFIAHSGQDVLYKNNNNGSFTSVATSVGLTESSSKPGEVGIWCDFNNDGYLDLYVANSGSNANFIYINDTDGTFTELGSTIGLNQTKDTRWAICGDYDADGDMDIFVANYNEAQSLFTNRLIQTGNTATNYLKVKANLSTNGPAIGAKVQVDLDDDGNFTGNVLTRYIESYTGNELVAHFGLGSTAQVDVKVTFPDGTATTSSNVAANQTVTITDQ
jgi:hypothetical protein